MKQVIRYFVFIFVLCLFGSYAFPIRQVSCACSNEFCHCEAGPCPPGYTALCDCTGFVSPGGDIVNLDCRCGCNKETPPLIEPPARSDKMSITPLIQHKSWSDVALTLHKGVSMGKYDSLSNYISFYGIYVSPSKRQCVDKLFQDGKPLINVLRDVARETKEDVNFLGIWVTSQPRTIPVNEPVVRMHSPGVSASFLYCLMLCRYNVSFDFLLDPEVSDKVIEINANGITLEEFQKDLMISLYNN